DGTVLVAGGQDLNGNTPTSAEIYSPTAGTVASTGSLNTSSSNQTAGLLSNGKALLMGGRNIRSSANTILSRTELYDPSGQVFTGTASLVVPRVLHTATLMPDGTILHTGGEGPSSTVTATAELFDPSNQVFIGAGALATARDSHTATLLND